MLELYVYLACAILACLAIFQAALALGAPIGKYAWGGAHEVLPTKLRIGSLVSILLYGVFAAVILNKAGVIHAFGTGKAAGVGIWVITIYFFIGVLMNAISRSKYERVAMTPVALLLAVLCLLVTIS